MKKICTLLLVFATVVAMANPVDKNVAESVALNHYTHYAPASIDNYSLSGSFETKFEGLTTFYTFTFTSGGFVIVAADDASIPVLGFSYDGQADVDVNPSTKAWLDTYSKQMAEIAGSKLSNAETRPQWDNILTNNMERGVMDVNPLLTTTWDQGCFYNTLCPVENSAGYGSCNHAWTGCVATTMAQIMKYHAFPETGLGYHSYTHAAYGLQSADFGNTTYNFAAMPNNVTSNNTAVATLMFHAGVSVNMNYAADGSGAYSDDVPFALVNYFNYSPTTELKSIADYPVMADWWALLRADLDAGRPIYYSGSSTASGGHAWVCDGYRISDNKFHFNWGWSGSYNGYFAIGALNPGGNNFNDDNRVVIGITPGNNTATWIAQNSGFVAASRGISFMHAPSATVAWATSYDGSIASAPPINEFTRTTNGGETWTSGQVLGGNTYGLGNICALDGSIAYVAVYNGVGAQNNTCGVYKTSNGGTTWTQLPGALQGSASFANNVYFWNEQEGMCHGDVKDGYFEIYTTINGGTTWQRVPQTSITGGPPASGEGGWTSVIETTGDNTIMFGTNKGKVYISDDRGFTWRVTSSNITPATNGGINQIAFSDPDNGIVVQTIAPIAYRRTANGGATWETFTPTGPFLVNDLMAVPGSPNTYVSTGAATGATGVSYSFDGGLTWTYFGATADRQFLAGDFFDNTCGYAGSFNADQNNGGMFRMIGELGAAGGGPQITVNPLEISASLYADEISISPFSITNPGEALLEWTIVIDQGTASWLSVDPTSGTTPVGESSSLEATIDAAGLVPGVYDAVITVNNNSTSTPVVNIPVHLTVLVPLLTPPSNLQATVDLDNVLLTWNAPATNRELLNYKIYRNSVVIADLVTETQYSDTGLQNGYYSYYTTAVYSTGESDPSEIVEVQITGVGVGNDNPESRIVVYPNPAEDFLNLKAGEEIISLRLFDASGLVVFEANSCGNQVRINTSKLKSGVYLLNTTTNKGVTTQKINIK